MLTQLSRATALSLILGVPAFAGDDHTGHGSDHGAKHGEIAMADGEMAVLATTETGLMILDGYARSATPTAKTGAAFLMIKNPTDTADRLINATSDAAQRVELHTHKEDDAGVMKMLHVPEGFEVPAGGALILERGGKHVMMMGLTAPFDPEGMVAITLTFEKAGEVEVMVPVDLDRKGGGHGGHGDHSGHDS